MKKNVFVVGFVILLIALIVVTLYGGLFSIGVIVKNGGDQYDGSASSLSSGLSKCNSDRAEAIAGGMDCEPCALTCNPYKLDSSQSVFDYGSASSLYSGSFNVNCDFIGGVPQTSLARSSDNPSFYKSFFLEYKSFCHDTIRTCVEQVGGAVVSDTYSVNHGSIEKLEYKYSITDCNGGVVGSSSSSFKYRLECDSGYYVDGRRLDSVRSHLGSCEPVEEVSTLNKGGSFSQVVVPSSVEVGNEVLVRGDFVPSVSGNYVISASLHPKTSTPLSIVSGFSASNPCNNDPDVYTIIKDLNAGDSFVFEISLPASVTGDFEVQVLAGSDCSMVETYDHSTNDISVLGAETFVNDTINTVIADEPDFYSGFLQDLMDNYSNTTTGSTDGVCIPSDLVIDGCVIGECSGNDVVLLDPIVCDGQGEIPASDFSANSGSAVFGGDKVMFWIVAVGAILVLITLFSVFVLGKKK